MFVTEEQLYDVAIGRISLKDVKPNSTVIKNLIELNFVSKDYITVPPKPKSTFIPQRGDRYSMTLSRFFSTGLSILFNPGDPKKVISAYGRILSQMSKENAVIVVRACKGDLKIDMKEAKEYYPEIFENKKKKTKSSAQNELVGETVENPADESLLEDGSDDGLLPLDD